MLFIINILWPIIIWVTKKKVAMYNYLFGVEYYDEEAAFEKVMV
jgi:hypothetical protein